MSIHLNYTEISSKPLPLMLQSRAQSRNSLFPYRIQLILVDYNSPSFLPIEIQEWIPFINSSNLLKSEWNPCKTMKVEWYAVLRVEPCLEERKTFPLPGRPKKWFICSRWLVGSLRNVFWCLYASVCRPDPNDAVNLMWKATVVNPHWDNLGRLIHTKNPPK